MPVKFSVIRKGAPTDKPFTIAIVANPFLEAPWNSGTIVADPIIGQLAAFQAAVSYVDTSLFVGLPGQKETVLSDPAISSQTRVVSLYDDSLSANIANALAAQDGNSNILIARRSVYKAFLAQYPDLNIGDVDIVYAISASPTHTRASAWFTSDDDEQGGVPFTLDGVAFVHRFFNLIPGTIALPVTSTSLTALHEFGHAISSYTNGMILDLYVDSPLGLNCKRGKPIPPIFCNYSGTDFQSDPSRDSLGYPPGWSSYHCALLDPTCPAVMDDYWQSSAGPESCQHDQVTRRFISDRVLTKIGRP